MSKPTEGRDARAFLDYVRREGKPGLVSFMGNAFAARIDQGAIHVFFDRRHANLIPMLKNPSHLGQLQELAKACFKRAVDIQFVVGDDPKVGEQNEAEEKALEEVRSNPAIKYLLDEFNGKILNCQILGENND